MPHYNRILLTNRGPRARRDAPGRMKTGPMPPMPRTIRALTCLSAAVFIPGCARPAAAPPASSYETVSADPRRDADVARRENARGLALMAAGDDAGAEAAFRAALAADVMCGPAHNHLGKLYYKQGKLYPAAWEFQYAMKLMPNQPEPPNNLGLVFEAAGKLDEAAESYNRAAALEPDNVPVLGNLARARVRRGDRDPDLRALLGKLVLRETRPDWLAWARDTLARMPAAAAERPAP